MNSKIKMQFDPEIAKELGVDCAIMYSNIEFWVEHNSANEKHYYDGHHWTYNSLKAFATLFPFWNESQLRRILDKLEKCGYIKTGNYNSNKYDRTKWYTCICSNTQLHLTKSTNGIVQTDEPIPDNKPDNKPDTIVELPNNETVENYEDTTHGSQLSSPKSKSDDVRRVYDHFIAKFDRNPNQYRLSDKRRSKLRVRLNDAGVDMLIKAINNTSQSGFYRGDNARGWQADLDFIIRSYEQVERLAAMNEQTKSACTQFNGVDTKWDGK